MNEREKFAKTNDWKNWIRQYKERKKENNFSLSFIQKDVYLWYHFFSTNLYLFSFFLFSFCFLFSSSFFPAFFRSFFFFLLSFSLFSLFLFLWKHAAILKEKLAKHGGGSRIFIWGGGGRRRSLCASMHITSTKPHSLSAWVQGPLKGHGSSRVGLMLFCAIWALF